MTRMIGSDGCHSSRRASGCSTNSVATIPQSMTEAAARRRGSRHTNGSVRSTSRPSVVVTERDRLVPPRRQLRLAEAIPGARVFPIDSDHSVCVSAPDLFVPVPESALDRGHDAHAPTALTRVTACAVRTLACKRGIADGSITVAFRRWKWSQVVVGGRYRTGTGLAEATSVDVVLESSITQADARRAGYDSIDELLLAMPARGLR